MLLKDLNETAKYYLNILTNQVSSPFAIDPNDHKKAIRDILDNFEGHLYQIYNSNMKYDHGSLKYGANHMSEEAYKFKANLSKGKFLNITHREHAKPLAILIEEMQGLSSQKLLTYLSNNLKSVTILKEEAKKLDKKYKTSMPNDSIFSRFESMGINVVEC